MTNLEGEHTVFDGSRWLHWDENQWLVWDGQQWLSDSRPAGSMPTAEANPAPPTPGRRSVDFETAIEHSDRPDHYAEDTTGTVGAQSEQVARPARRRQLLILSGVIALVGVAVAALIGATSGGHSSTAEPSESAGSFGATSGGHGTTADPSESDDGSRITSRAAACRVEALVAFDILINNTSSNGEISVGGEELLQAIGGQNPLFGLAYTLQNDYIGFRFRLQQGEAYAEDHTVSEVQGKCSAAGNPILTREQVGSLSDAASPASDADSLDQIAIFKR